jgi:hypothetical protein
MRGYILLETILAISVLVLGIGIGTRWLHQSLNYPRVSLTQSQDAHNRLLRFYHGSTSQEGVSTQPGPVIHTTIGIIHVNHQTQYGIIRYEP